MKKLILFLLTILIVTDSGVLRAEAENIGVPSECEDVMLQCFYWNSYQTGAKYGRTKWVDLLKDTTAIRENFDLVWFPPSAWGGDNGGVGYYHRQLSRQDGDWGTKGNLVKLIAALHNGGTKVLGDIVINHRNNKSSWVDFFPDNFGEGYGTFQFTQEHICAGDEAFTSNDSPAKGSTVHGAADTGTNDAGCRDLDHSNPYVQEWAKAYVRWMREVMLYDGFRYDMTLGYAGKYLSDYNEASQPYLSVSELWESMARQKQHLTETNYNTMIFDFQQKYELAKGIVNGAYGKLIKNSNSFRGQGLEKYAVTFIDNHDTFERDSYGSQQFGGKDLTSATTKAQILQANAYILMMPGVPCVFWPHWYMYKDEINTLIGIRKAAGIHSESVVTDETSGSGSYSATIQGHRRKVVLRLGKNRDMTTPAGYWMSANGEHYTVYTEVGEGVEEIIAKPSDDRVVKVLKDGHVYLMYKGTMYNVQGQKVE